MQADRLALMPVYSDKPTGPMCRVLRRMVGTTITSIRTGTGRVLCVLDGHPVDKRIVTGAITRGLITEAGDTDDTTTYTLTAAGRKWADTTTTEGE